MNSYLLGIVCLIYSVTFLTSLLNKNYSLALIYFAYALSLVGFIIQESHG